MKELQGKIALVAGATRGAGRGIACALGEAGATVYCTGRSTKEHPGARPETIEETAALVTEHGGHGLAVRVDHTVEAEVEALCQRIAREHGRLDILVNDIWGGESLVEMGRAFWRLSIEKGRAMFDRAVFSHIITSKHATPLLQKQGGLLVEITDGDHFGYRGELFYDLVKMSVIRLAFSMAHEVRRHKINVVAVTPGFLRSEEMLALCEVTEDNWRDGAAKDPNWLASETPLFVGRAVAALARDPAVAEKNGRVCSSWKLAREYGLVDRDGSRPDWGAHFLKAYGAPSLEATQEAYSHWRNGPIEIACPEWPIED